MDCLHFFTERIFLRCLLCLLGLQLSTVAFTAASWRWRTKVVPLQAWRTYCRSWKWKKWWVAFCWRFPINQRKLLHWSLSRLFKKFFRNSHRQRLSKRNSDYVLSSASSPASIYSREVVFPSSPEFTCPLCRFWCFRCLTTAFYSSCPVLRWLHPPVRYCSWHFLKNYTLWCRCLTKFEELFKV